MIILTTVSWLAAALAGLEEMVVGYRWTGATDDANVLGAVNEDVDVNVDGGCAVGTRG